MNAGALSVQLLMAVQEKRDATSYIDKLASVLTDQLTLDLKEENSRRAFWINCYNAFTQILIKSKSPDLLLQTSRTAFFNAKEITIAGHALSLNDIEHGMLRHSRIWWSKGYLTKIFPSRFEKQFRVPLDFRIHFALNCGAVSCPAIRFYDPVELDDELDEAMNSFLSSEVKYDKPKRTVIVSKIFSWYRGDFGGKNGIINLLWSQHLIAEGKKVKLRFKKYDWSLLLHKFEG